ncbi:MAG: lipopolysaccharide kinase InaA family protein [Candidatus Binatia bacterium]
MRVIAARLELDEMVDLLCGPARESMGEEVDGGRGGTRRIVLPGGKAVYLRKYLRGGMARFVSRDLYLRRPPRPLRELLITEKARAAGCRVPAVVAVCIEEAGLFYRGWIVTSALDATRALIAEYLDTESDSRHKELLLAAGRSIRAIHDAGVYHPDLTGNNLLVGTDDSVSIIDFDRAVLARPNLARLAERGKDRFWRSMTGLCRAAGKELDSAQKRWLDRGYQR